MRRVPVGVALPDETGETFAENAHLKAATVFAALGSETAVLADDSGLEVAALHGAPGVQSARYAGNDACDDENVRKLLAELSRHEDRTARFVCALCLILPSVAARPGEAPRVFTAEGLLDGRITSSPRGTDGFGYDPVFEPLGRTQTLAESSPADKDRVSHRGAAAKALLARLRADGIIADGS